MARKKKQKQQRPADYWTNPYYREQEEKENKFKDMSIKEHIDMLIASGIGKKDAIKQAAQERGVSKRDVYNEYEKE